MFTVNSIDNKLNFSKSCAINVQGTGSTKKYLLAAFMAELAQYGYTLSSELYEELLHVSIDVTTEVQQFLLDAVKESVGGHVTHTPLYINFPINVNTDLRNWYDYAASIANLPYVYTDDDLMFPLDQKTELKVINFAKKINAGTVFSNMCASKISLSTTDKALVVEYIKEHKQQSLKFIPQEVNSKENLAVVMVAVQQYTDISNEKLQEYLKTATDILRVACEMSGGDSTLNTPTKFKLKNSQRRFIMAALESVSSVEEDLMRNKGAWIKLAEVIHTGTFKKRFPCAFLAIQDLRENVKIETFNSKVEHIILCVKQGDTLQLVKLLQLLATRPGEFARRLDFMLANANEETQQLIHNMFTKIASDISTPVLLKLHGHIGTRNNKHDYRYFIPKGNCGKVKVIPTDIRNVIRTSLVTDIQKTIFSVLSERFKDRSSLGTVFIHDSVKSALIPLVQRDATAGLRTLARGSRVAFDEATTFIRPFLYWKNKENGDRVDVDLSAVGYSDKWACLGNVSYWSLYTDFAEHSGDITGAPNGASEFLNIDINKALRAGYRYITVVVNTFTGQPFSDFECFAGIGENHHNVGKNYEPTTVRTKFDLSGDSEFNVPLVLDLKERMLIWCDLSLNSGTASNTYSEETGILALSKICESMLDNNTTIATLLEMHMGRYNNVYYGSDADLEKNTNDGIVFDNVFDLEFATNWNKISSDFM